MSFKFVGATVETGALVQQKWLNISNYVGIGITSLKFFSKNFTVKDCTSLVINGFVDIFKTVVVGMQNL